MKVFQLKVEGPYSSFDGVTAMYSRRLFRTKQAAEAYLAEFSTLCIGDGLMDLESITRHWVLELELED